MPTQPKSALILLAHGSEEIEFSTAYDLLVRAGIKVTSASVGEVDSQGAVKCSRGMRVLPDLRLEEMGEEETHSFNLLLIPGGIPGATTLASSTLVTSLVKYYFERAADTFVAMICAGPLVALESGIWEDQKTWKEGRIRVTSHPSVKEKLEEKFNYVEEDVVIDGNLITSRGPGTSIVFSLAIIKALLGPAKEKEIRGPLMIPA